MISVLCVDDDAAHLSLEKRCLEEPGALTVTTALSAPEALRAMETSRFDAVVADYQMPGMDGIELLKTVRAANPGLPFIIFTGKGKEEVVIEAFNDGVDFYLQKNGDPKVLFARLKDTIKKAVNLGVVWKAFHDSELRYRRLFETAQDGILILDAESGAIMDANPFILTLIGYTRDEMLGKKLWEIGFIRDKTLAEQAAADLKRTGYIRYDDLPLETKDGRALEVEFISNVYDVGNKNIAQCNIRDITDRRRAEEMQSRLAAIVENSDAAIIGKTLDGIITSWNTGAERIYGYSAQEVVGKSISLLMPPDHMDNTGLILERIRNGEPVIRYETLRRKKDGGLINIAQIISPIKDSQNCLIGVSTIAQDITKRKQTEEALKENERFLTNIVEQIPDMIFVKDARDLRFVRFNKAGEDLLGYSRAEMLGKNDYDLFPKDEADFFIRNDREVLLTNQLSDSPEEKIQTRYKGERILHTKKIPIADEKGDPRYLLGISEDITERKRGEDALRETKDYLENLIRYANVPIISWNPELKITEFNRTSEQLNGMTKEEVIGQPLTILFPDKTRDKSMDLIRRALRGEHWETVEIPIRHVSGETRILLWNSANILDPTGKVMATIAQGRDITERKAAEEAIRTIGEDLECKVAERTSDLSDVNLALITEIEIRLDAEKQLNKTLGEKDVLLREVHHRVKNNLQIIISLLNLQSRYITDETTRSAFRECQSRVRAMALVHEKLYQSTDLTKLDLNNYLKFLGDNLFQFLGMKGKGITLTMDIRDIFLAIDTAIPVGLMINELISNSLKHAFPDGRKGNITLVIQREDHTLTILFQDNGVGIAEGFDWRNAESLGLRLVISLVEQLQGTIELDRKTGTMFTIFVKEKE